jgi:hypothetical protein
MERSSLRTGLAGLLIRSRQALNLYSEMSARASSDHLRDLQIEQWRLVNLYLVESLAQIVSYSQSRLLSASYILRDSFNQQWRELETRLAEHHKNIIILSEQGDFAKVALVAKEATLAKAKMQASQAAFNELENCLKQSSSHRPVIKLDSDDAVDEPAQFTQDSLVNNSISHNNKGAKVIHFSALQRRSVV